MGSAMKKIKQYDVLKSDEVWYIVKRSHLI